MSPFARPALFGAAWLTFATLLAPDVAFRDSGEIGGAAWQLGIAHPTGFSLDMLWLHAWTWLPLGSAAFRMSLGVAFASAAGLVLLFDLVATLSRHVAGALVAVGALATFATFVGTATLIEVYSTALVLTLASLREHVRAQPRIAVLAVLAGLSVGAHVTAWVACAAVLLATVVVQRRTLSLGRTLRAMALGAPVALTLVTYFPLRSATDPAFDWGDPETPARLWEHLSAGRIRSAFADTKVDVRPFFSQLAELAWCVPLALLAIVRMRSRILPPVVLLLLDIAYGVFVNPMGIVDRQVGHLAGAMIALLAGVGASELLAPHLRPRPRLVAAAALPLVLVLGGVISLANADLDPDGSDALIGGAGVLVSLPSRAIYVCASDDACASALFARYAVGERTDVDVVVAQHLWEPRERAKLSGPPDSRRRPLNPTERVALARRTLDAMRASSARPMRYEDSAVLTFRDQLHVAEPLLFSLEETPTTEWGLYLAARPAASTRAAEVVSRAYEALGRGHLRAGDVASAYTAFARSVIATPRRAVTWINLGAVAARRGRWDEAIAVTDLATRLEPERPTAWLNLARYRATRDRRDGLATLDQAARFVPEERLRSLRAELSLPTAP